MWARANITTDTNARQPRRFLSESMGPPSAHAEVVDVGHHILHLHVLRATEDLLTVKATTNPHCGPRKDGPPNYAPGLVVIPHDEVPDGAQVDQRCEVGDRGAPQQVRESAQYCPLRGHHLGWLGVPVLLTDSGESFHASIRR